MEDPFKDTFLFLFLQCILCLYKNQSKSDSMKRRKKDDLQTVQYNFQEYFEIKEHPYGFLLVVFL